MFLKHFLKEFQKYSLTPIESYCRVKEKNGNPLKFLGEFKYFFQGMLKAILQYARGKTLN